MKITQIQEEYMGKIETINCIDKTNFTSGSMTTYDYCPRCNYGGLFRVYSPYRELETKYSYISIYESQCPKCNKGFDIVDTIEKEED